MTTTKKVPKRYQHKGRPAWTHNRPDREKAPRPERNEPATAEPGHVYYAYTVRGERVTRWERDACRAAAAFKRWAATGKRVPTRHEDVALVKERR